LSSGNRAYVQLVRNLGKGVIRIGGNVSDYTRYDVGAAAVSGHKSTVLNYESLRQFRGFLDAVGWKLIWGLNLGTGTVDNAVALARDGDLADGGPADRLSDRQRAGPVRAGGATAPRRTAMNSGWRSIANTKPPSARCCRGPNSPGPTSAMRVSPGWRISRATRAATR
jgi:hypothetical protein